MSNLHPITRSRHISGRYCVGERELIELDVVEFIDDTKLLRGQVVHDGWRYVVTTGRRIVPLSEIMVARFLRHGLA